MQCVAVLHPYAVAMSPPIQIPEQLRDYYTSLTLESKDVLSFAYQTAPSQKATKLGKDLEGEEVELMLKARVLTYSSYKHHNTVKYLIDITQLIGCAVILHVGVTFVDSKSLNFPFS